MIDKQRIAAVRKLEAMGYTFTGGEWTKPANEDAIFPDADYMHLLLIHRADTLAGCAEGSEEEQELAAITQAIEAYGAARWPAGKTDGGKG
jgi:hypothetical protein